MTEPVRTPAQQTPVSGFANPMTLTGIYCDAAADLAVYADNTLLTLGEDYSVDNLNDADGPEVTITAPEDWAAYELFTVFYKPTITQNSDLSLGGVFGSAYEEGLDRLARRMRAVDFFLNRAVTLSPNSDIDSAGLTIDVVADGHFWKYSGGRMVDAGDVTDIADAAANATAAREDRLLAEEAARQAALSQAAINLPALTGNANMMLVVNTQEEGYDFHTLNYVRGNHVLTPYDAALGNKRVSEFDPYTAEVDEAIQELFDLGKNSWSVTRQCFDVAISGANRQWTCAGEVGIVGLKQPGLPIMDMSIFSKAASGIALNFGDSNHINIHGVLNLYCDPDNPPNIGILIGAVDTGSGFRPSMAFKNAGLLRIAGKVHTPICNFGGEVPELGRHYISTTSRSPTSALYATLASGQAFEDRFPGMVSSLCTLPNGTNQATARSDVIHSLGMVHLAHNADFNLPILGYTNVGGSEIVVSVSPSLLLASGLVNGNPIAIAGVTTTVVTPGKKKLNANWFNVESVDTVAGTFALTGTDGTDYDAWLSGGNVTPRSGPAIYAEGAAGVTTDNGYLVTQGNTLCHLDGGYGGAIRAVKIRCQGETQPTSIMRIKTDADGIVVQGIETDILSAAQTYGVALFEKEGTGPLTVQGHDLWVNSMPDVPPGGIWQDEDGDQSSITIIDARYRLPKATIADVAVQSAGFADFTGTITTLDDGRTRTFTKRRDWTPVLKFGGNAVGMVYAAGGQIGWVKDAGEFQIAHFRIALGGAAGNKGTSTGNATVEGLLDAVGYSGSGTGHSGSVIIDSYASLASITKIMGRVPAGLTSITLLNGGAASATALTEANFTDSSVFEGTVIYRTMA